MDEPLPRCDHGGQEVICDFCGREYVCTPSDDHYHTPEGHQLCLRCLVDDLPTYAVILLPEDRCSPEMLAKLKEKLRGDETH